MTVARGSMAQVSHRQKSCHDEQSMLGRETVYYACKTSNEPSPGAWVRGERGYTSRAPAAPSAGRGRRARPGMMILMLHLQ